MENANIFAHFMLLLWVPLALTLCSMMRPALAVAAITMGAVMFLPEKLAYDFPVLPPFTKNSIANIAALIGCMCVAPQKIFGPQASRGARWLFILNSISVILTAATNRDTLIYGPTVLPGLSNHDIFSDVIQETVKLALPFFLGQAIFRTTQDMRDLLKALVIAGLVYTPFVLYEARMSPQLHTKFYGYFQHDWLQALRSGGFRPFVFMAHGLSVAFFMCTTVVAAAGLNKIKYLKRGGWIVLFLFLVLITCKTLSAFLYLGIALPLIWLLRPTAQLRIATWLCVIVFVYPLLRENQVFSTDALVQFFAENASEERSRSLAFRFNNENVLLAKAEERIWFGWGGWGRNRVFDPITGEDISVTDGQWVIALGSRGTIGFLVQFGALLIPAFVARRAAKRAADKGDQQLLATMGLIIALIGVDTLPNSVSSTLPLLFAGALTAVSSTVSAQKRTRASLQPARAAMPRVA